MFSQAIRASTLLGRTVFLKRSTQMLRVKESLCAIFSEFPHKAYGSNATSCSVRNSIVKPHVFFMLDHTTSKLEIRLPTCSGLPSSISNPSKSPTNINILDKLTNQPGYEKIDPLVSLVTIEEPQSLPVKIECFRKGNNMLQVRKRKIRKHIYIKRMNKNLGKYIKIKALRYKEKDKSLQAILVAKIKEAENFNPELYMKDVLKKIKERPKPETAEESRARMYELYRKNRSNVWVYPPKIEEERF